MKVRLKDNVTNEVFCEETFISINNSPIIDVDYMKKNELEATLSGEDLVVVCKCTDGSMLGFDYYYSEQDIWEVVE